MRKKQFLSSIAGGLMISCLCVGCANDNVTNEATLEESEEITEENTENNEEEAVSEENSEEADDAVEENDTESLEDNTDEQSGDIFLSEDGSVYILQDYDKMESYIVDGDEEIPVDIAMGVYGPSIAKTDADGDGEDEYLIAECEGTGTGVSLYGLCIVEKDGDDYKVTKYECDYFTAVIEERVSYSYDKDSKQVTFTASNENENTDYSVTLDAEDYKETDVESVVWSDVVRIEFKDGVPYLTAPSGYVCTDIPMPDYEQAVVVSAPISIDTDSNIEVGDFSLGEE